MPVTEQHLGPGSWSVRLSRRGLLDAADIIKFFGTLLITPQRIDLDAFSDAQIKSMAAYSGVVTRINKGEGQVLDIGGRGIVALLGTRGGKGFVYKVERFFAEDTLTDVLTRTASWPVGLLFKDNGSLIGLAPGVITDPTSGGQTYTGPHIYQTPSRAIETFLGLWSKASGFDMEWRANPDGTLDVGRQEDLFVVQPRVVLVAQSGFSPEHESAATRSLSLEQDAENYVTAVLVMGSGYGFSQVAVAGAIQEAFPSNVEQAVLTGAGLERYSMVSRPFVSEELSQRQAEREVETATVVRQELNLDLDSYDISGESFAVGDTLFIWDPVAGLVDPTNEVHYRGQVLNPVTLRVFSNTWEITEEMGVLYRAGDGTYTDLSRWVEYEADASRAGLSNQVVRIE